MRKNYENDKSFKSSWYALSTNRLLLTLGALKGEVNSDVCVVGAGFTGLSAALELAQQGFSVTLLEATTIGGGASGKNGGQLHRGLAQSPQWLTDRYGADNARMIGNMSLKGTALILERINKYDIKCDLTFGLLVTALTERHQQELRDEAGQWRRIGHDDLTYFDKDETQAHINCDKYIGALYDPKGGHFHPLNYALGLAAAGQKLGVKIYDETPVLSVKMEEGKNTVLTAQGKVAAKFVVIAGDINLPEMKAPLRRSITAQAHMIATEPLGEERARKMIPSNAAIADANFITNYFRFSADWRLLFGGNCNYNGRDNGNEANVLRARMLGIFPKLNTTRIDHCWHGPLDLTANRLPDIGRLSPTVYYAHGFGGHGVVATNLAGKVLAEAITGTATRFDVFQKIHHIPFAGGDLLKRPLFQLGMWWYQLRDMLH